jgi:hypothetical protein
MALLRMKGEAQKWEEVKLLVTEGIAIRVGHHGPYKDGLPSSSGLAQLLNIIEEEGNESGVEQPNRSIASSLIRRFYLNATNNR